MTGIGRQTGLLLLILTLVLAMSTAVLAQVGPDIPPRGDLDCRYPVGQGT